MISRLRNLLKSAAEAHDRTYASHDGKSGPVEVYRYERKYLITEAVAQEVRRFVTAWLPPDEHMAADAPCGYRVLSLYLDTPQFDLCRQTVEGVRQRYKLRIRFYDEAADGLAMLEVKNRSSDTIHKQRAAISKASAAALLRGECLSAAHLLSPSSRGVRALADFTERKLRLNAAGAAFVGYYREAYAARPPYDVRITIDRQLTARDGRGAQSLELPPEEVLAAPGMVVLEVKHGGCPPDWVHDLTRMFHLDRTSFPKYVRCVDALRMAPPWYSASCGGRYVGVA